MHIGLQIGLKLVAENWKAQFAERHCDSTPTRHRIHYIPTSLQIQYFAQQVDACGCQ
jgi:hypothetical protein